MGKIAIRHASFDAARMLAARWKRELSLAAAFARLPEQTQEEVFLYYFQHWTQKEIGEQSGSTRSAIGRHIQLAYIPAHNFINSTYWLSNFEMVKNAILS